MGTPNQTFFLFFNYPSTILFLNHYKPVCPSLRFKRKITSFMTSKKINKRLKFSFFKKKIYNNHKFLSNSNCAYRLNMNNVFLGKSILIKLLKTSYSNSFFGFFEFSSGAIVVKKLNYGFSHFLPLTEYGTFWGLGESNNASQLLNKFFLFFVDVNAKIFFLKCRYSEKMYASAAGTFCLIANKEFSKCLFFVKVPSKKFLFFDYFSSCFLGRVSNIYYRYTFFSSFSSKFKIKKKQQSTRGIAKNPVDHPNGGRSKIKKPFMNPWGKVAKRGK